MIEVGKKIPQGVIEKVSEDGRIIAVYSQWSLGDKGMIYAKNFFNQRDYLGKVPTITVGGVGYHMIERCAEYADLMRRFNWYVTDKASAYSRKEL